MSSEASDTDIAPVDLDELGPGVGAGDSASTDLLAEVNLQVTVELGSVRMRVRDLLRLTEGSVIELDRAAGAPVDVLANGSLIARGDVVVVDDELGVRITELVRKN